MTGGEVMGGISLLVTLTLGLLVFVTNRRANTTSEKRVSIEEQDSIAARRLGEIRRLDELVQSLRRDVDDLRTTVTDLQKRDREKQQTIDDQADELEKTNDILADVRTLFTRFVGRVEEAWLAGHPMPALTDAERALLETTIPYRTRILKEK